MFHVKHFGKFGGKILTRLKTTFAAHRVGSREKFVISASAKGYLAGTAPKLLGVNKQSRLRDKEKWDFFAALPYLRVGAQGQAR
ncbi:MAG: hypothetical protein ACREDD_04240 [Methylocella sp.]